MTSCRLFPYTADGKSKFAPKSRFFVGCAKFYCFMYNSSKNFKYKAGLILYQHSTYSKHEKKIWWLEDWKLEGRKNKGGMLEC